MPPSLSHEDIRLKAVQAVLDGEKQAEIARLLGVTRQAVSKWVNMYHERGAKSLKARPRGRPKGSSLPLCRLAHIAKIIIDQLPEQVDLPFYLWSPEAVAVLIERRYGIHFSISTVRRYLRRWGIPFQTTVCQSNVNTLGKMHRWLEEEYPTIQKQAKREKAVIYWLNKTMLVSAHAIERPNGLSDKAPIILGPDRWFDYIMISAISSMGDFKFIAFKNHHQPGGFMEFLRRLAHECSRKVFLIIDDHPVHCARKTKMWIAENMDGIALFFVPSCSLELSTNELWGLKSHLPEGNESSGTLGGDYKLKGFSIFSLHPCDPKAPQRGICTITNKLNCQTICYSPTRWFRGNDSQVLTEREK